MTSPLAGIPKTKNKYLKVKWRGIALDDDLHDLYRYLDDGFLNRLAVKASRRFITMGKPLTNTGLSERELMLDFLEPKSHSKPDATQSLELLERLTIRHEIGEEVLPTPLTSVISLKKQQNAMDVVVNKLKELVRNGTNKQGQPLKVVIHSTWPSVLCKINKRLSAVDVKTLLLEETPHTSIQNQRHLMVSSSKILKSMLKLTALHSYRSSIIFVNMQSYCCIGRPLTVWIYRSPPTFLLWRRFPIGRTATIWWVEHSG